MKLRAIWTFLRTCLLTAALLLLSAIVFAALLYACFVLGYWLSDSFVLH